VERDAHVRAARRRQALDALEFERQREAMLAEQLEDVVAEADGPALDASLFARMSDEDVSRVRVAFGDVGLPFDPDEDSSEDAGAGDEAETGDVTGEEVARLEDEIESSRRVQAALAQYLELLAEPGSTGAGG
jgi:hypothetical protein